MSNNSVRNNNRYINIARETIWVGLGQALSAIGALVGLRLLTNVLAPDTYGTLQLAMTIVALTQQMLVGPLSQSFSRFYSSAVETQRLSSFLQGGWHLIQKGTLWLIGATSLLILFLILTNQFKLILLVIAGLLFAIISGYNTILDSLQNAARKRIIVATHQALGQWLRFLLAVALCHQFIANSAMAMFGYALASLLIFSSQLYFFKPVLTEAYQKRATDHQVQVREWFDQIGKYAYPFISWSIFTWSFTASDRWSLNFAGSATMVGFYAVLYQLGYYPINMLFGLVMQVAEPIIFSRVGDGTDPRRVKEVERFINLMVLMSLLFTAVLAGICFLLHRQIFALFASPQYHQISALLPLMVLSGGFYAATQVAGLWHLSKLQPAKLIRPKIVTSLLGIILNIVGAVWAGIIGVICAGIVAASINLLWIFLLKDSTIKPDKAITIASAD